MNVEQTLRTFHRIPDCEIQVARTGNPLYKRGYIIYKGVTYGRICFFNGEYSHVKWYGGSLPNENVKPHNYFYYVWMYLEMCNQLLSMSEFERAIETAEVFHKADYCKKKAAREQLPKVREDGKRIKRRPVRGRSVRAFMIDVLRIMADKRGLD